MKTRFITLLLGLAGIITYASGQDNFIFENSLRDTASFVQEDFALESHYLGEQMALKYTRMRKTYTYVTEGTPTQPSSQTIVTKPTIYYSLKKLNNYYKKQLKKGEIDTGTAVEELGWYFDVGFAIYPQNTDEFEEALKKAKKPDEIAGVFAQVEFK